MNQRRWINQSQPQTLQGAVIFSYLNAVLALILTFGHAAYFVVLLALAVAAFGIANDRRWGYWGAIVLGGIYCVGLLVLLIAGGGFGAILDLLFGGILMALLLHPESRHYERIWFK